MKPTFISRDKNEVKFSIEFTGEEFESAVIDVYRANKQKFMIDGFRKGKAPKSLIEARYGEDIFFEDAINQIFSQNYPKALDELSLNVIDKPGVEFSEIKKGEGFIVTLTVNVYPDFEVNDYKGVEIEKVNADVTDDAVKEELLTLQKRNARLVLVERQAALGDMLLIDYEGYLGEEKFDGGSAERYMLKLGSNTFIPGFEEQLIGAAAGEDKEIKVTFPEDYHAADLAGKEVLFKCKIHEIKEEELPELNDDFAKDVSEHDTLDELKSEIRERLEKSAAAQAENRMKNAAIEKVYNSNEIEVPDVMIEDETDNMLSEFENQLKYQGLSLDAYLEYMKKDVGDMKNELRNEALKKVKTKMILSQIAEQEKIDVTEEETEKEIAAIAGHYKMEPDKVKEIMGSRAALIENDIKISKAAEFIFKNASIK